MIILGIDPSYTGTGAVLFDPEYNLVLESAKITAPNGVYVGIDKIHQNCEFIINELAKFTYLPIDYAVIEYPALATRSGAYLAILNGYLSSCYNGTRIIWLPPNAVDSYTKNKSHSKSYLVNWCKERGLVDKRTSHDICTAIILAIIGYDVLNNRYKNTSFKNFNEEK